VLRLKQFKIKDLLKFNFLEAPKKQDIENSIENMKMIQALDEDQNITAMGKIIV